MTQSPFQVAIVGGGIGGLFAALSIRHFCGDKVAIDVFEQASEYKEIGAGVGLAVNAARLMHKLGMGEQLNSIAGQRDGVWFRFCRYDNGEEILTIPSDDSKPIRQAPVARSDLLDLLKKTVEDRHAARLHTKKRFVSLNDEGDHVAITFEDGSIFDADLVVAADGIHSAVRNLYIHDQPIYSGRVAYRGVLPVSQFQHFWPFKSYSAIWSGKGRHFLVFPISANTALNIVAFVDVEESETKHVEESWVSTCERKEVEDAYQGFEPVVQKLIALMDDRPSRWKINDRAPLSQWHYMGGKVMLLGDAAHAMLPHMGSGAGQAVEDGYVLGKALDEFLSGTDGVNCGTLEAAAAFYQKVRLPRAQKVQAKSREAGDTYNMQWGEMRKLPFEECIPLFADKTKNQMKFVWEADLDTIYADSKK